MHTHTGTPTLPANPSTHSAAQMDVSPQMYPWLFLGNREREGGQLDPHGKWEVCGGVGVAPKTSQQSQADPAWPRE